MNDDLLKLKIDIKEENDALFLELAILLDKPDFLHMLPKFRKDYGIDELISIDKFYEKMDEFIENNTTSRINFSKYKNAKELMKVSYGVESNMDLYEKLGTEADIVCYQFRRPPCFAEAIKQAIFCGVVEDGCLDTTPVEIIESGQPLNASSLQLPQPAIFITPTTTYESLKTAFQKAKKLYETDPKLAYYCPRIDFVNNIRDYYYFYWKRQEFKNGRRLTYKQIADEYETKHENEYDTTTYLDVLKAVKIYEKLLTL